MKGLYENSWMASTNIKIFRSWLMGRRSIANFPQDFRSHARGLYSATALSTREYGGARADVRSGRKISSTGISVCVSGTSQLDAWAFTTMRTDRDLASFGRQNWEARPI